MFSDTYSLMVCFQETDELNCYMNNDNNNDTNNNNNHNNNNDNNRKIKDKSMQHKCFHNFYSMLGWILRFA